jgi:hypothetical protein
MRYFEHRNNLRNHPVMQPIIEKLGVAGYGKAVLLLEILTETGGVGTDRSEFSLPLSGPTDLTFWARQFQSSKAEARSTLVWFAKCGLILPFQESGEPHISAPVIGDWLAEYQKKGKKKKGEAAQTHQTRQDRTTHHTTPPHPTVTGHLGTCPDTADGRVGRMARIYSNAGKGILNCVVGKKEALALPDDDDTVCRVWEHWLKNRNLEGMDYPLLIFSRDEYPTASTAVATATKQADKEKEMAAQAAEITEKARIEFEEKARHLREEAAAPVSEGIFG